MIILKETYWMDPPSTCKLSGRVTRRNHNSWEREKRENWSASYLEGLSQKNLTPPCFHFLGNCSGQESLQWGFSSKSRGGGNPSARGALNKKIKEVIKGLWEGTQSCIPKQASYTKRSKFYHIHQWILSYSSWFQGEWTSYKAYIIVLLIWTPQSIQFYSSY